MLPNDLLTGLIDGLGIDVGSLAEFTIEANPEDVTDEWVSAVVAMGIGRVSMGIQSLVEAELSAIGRRHTAGQALTAINTLMNGGIRNISCDLIYGLPGQTSETWRYSLQRLLDTGIVHLSAYMLTYEPGTRLSVQRNLGRVREAADEDIELMYGDLVDMAARYGFRHYEISNFALDGYRAIHNSSYWDGTPYLGLGPSAHSFDGAVRRANPTDIKRYVADPGHCYDEEVPESYSAYNDRIITGLRTDEGIDVSGFTQSETDILEAYVRNGMMAATALRRFRITEHAWLMADRIMSDFIRVE
ncbi:MAG: coproporphyrinogen III oxidase family protein [Muribaculaceae bacterium]|nr:coproporphyrinogen III oxidase family protein [Muribaculaceae bacterium]